MTKGLEFHEAANLFPLLEGEEYETFKADIVEHGLLEPGVLCDGKILDGRNRYRVCQELGKPFPTREWDGQCGDPWTYVASVNLHRKHLDIIQRSRIAIRLREYYAPEMAKKKSEGQKKGGRRGGGDRKSKAARESTSASKDAQVDPPPDRTGPRSRASHKAAKAADVSGATVDRMRRIEGKGSKELNKAVDAKEISLVCAAALAGHFSKSQQDVILKGGMKAVKEALLSLKDREQDDTRHPIPGYNKTEQYAVECARCAITQLEQIPVKNPGRDKAFSRVEKWIEEQRRRP